MKSIIEFIKNCTDCWHTAAEIADILNRNGFVSLDEGDVWDIKSGGKYYVTRNMSSIIAFKVPRREYKAYMIAAAHGDSPSFKIKAVPELHNGKYLRLNIEKYGGMIMQSWLDRPLSVSGRVIADIDGVLETRLVNLDRNSLIIPSLAIHLARDAKGGEPNMTADMPPMYGTDIKADAFINEVAAAANVTAEQIKGFDLMLYNREEGIIWGANSEFISAPRLDDLQCVYSLLNGFIDGQNDETVQVYCVFDNEEVGSGTKQGAKSDFLSSTLCRINESCGRGFSDNIRALNSSFMVSADNGHAVHPNRAEMSDAENAPQLGKGVVIKYNAAQRYTTDAASEAIFKKICERAGVPFQVYANRSDIPGGSTLGNLAAEKLGINMADVGLAQLAMHSAFETAGAEDVQFMTDAIRCFYSSRIESAKGSFKIYFE